MTTAPAILGHCISVYKAMEEQSKEDPQGHKYFEGAVTRLITGIGLSNPYYSQVMTALKKMECIRQGRRGGGGMGSVWYLLQEPTEELWSANAENLKTNKSQKATQTNMQELEQRQRAMLQQVGRLEQRVAVLEAKIGG